MMERFAKGIIKHSKAVVVIWIVILLASAPFAYMALTSDDVFTFGVQKEDNTESGKGYDILRDSSLFDYKSLDFVVIVEYQQKSQSGGVQAVADGLTQRIGAQFPGESSVTLLPVQGTEHHGKGFMIINIPDRIVKASYTKDIRDMIVDIRNTSGVEIGNTYVTGGAALSYDLSQSSVSDMKKIDPVAVLLVLILIGLFFSSIVAAGVPPVTIGIAFSLTLTFAYILAKYLGFDVFMMTPTIALVAMLGAGCDYCIFIMARYMEERRSGKNREDALTESVRWAGESVIISGLCVIICFGMISFCSYKIMSALGIVLAFGIVIALLAAVTLIPAIINLIGDRMFYPSKIGIVEQSGTEVKKGGVRGFFSDLGNRYFDHSARFSMKWAWAIIIAAILVTVPLATVAANEKTSFDIVQIMPDCESKDGVEVLETTSIGGTNYGGIIMPIYEVIELEKTVATEGKVLDASGNERKALIWSSYDDGKNLTYSTFYATYSVLTFCKYQGLAHDIIGVREVKKNIGIMAGAISTEAALEYVAEIMNQYSVEKKTDWDKYSVEYYALYVLVEKYPEYKDNPVIKMIKEIYENVPDSKDRYSVYDYELNSRLGSLSAPTADGHQYVKVTIILQDEPMSVKSMHTVEQIRNICHNYEKNQRTGEMPTVTATYTAGISALMMDIQNKSTQEFLNIDIIVIILILILLLFVMRSYLTPVRSVLTIVMGVVWSYGLTALVFDNIMHIQVFWAIPILVFLICLGLGMDYDILLTTRIREYVCKGMDNDTAISKALAHSGAIITICGIIMGGAFLSLMLSSTPLLQQLGFAIGVTILVDALIIRTYIVPAVMHKMGKWNWIGPKFLNGFDNHK